MKGTEGDELSLTRMQRGRKWQQDNNHKRSGDKDLQEIDMLLSSTKKDELHAEERNGKDLPSPSSSSNDASSEYGHLTQSAGNWLLQQKTKKKQQKRVPTGIRNILMEEEDFLWDNLKSFGTEEAAQQKGTDKEEGEEEEEEEEQPKQKQKPWKHGSKEFLREELKKTIDEQSDVEEEEKAEKDEKADKRFKWRHLRTRLAVGRRRNTDGMAVEPRNLPGGEKGKAKGGGLTKARSFVEESRFLS